MDKLYVIKKLVFIIHTKPCDVTVSMALVSVSRLARSIIYTTIYTVYILYTVQQFSHGIYTTQL